MLSNFFTIISKINNITSNNNKLIKINTGFLLNNSFKKNMDNYIALSNQKSFEIYSKYNRNTFLRFSVLDINKKSEESICQKYINPSCLYIGCFYIFLASFSVNFNLQII
jgi:hypothetical protein